MVEWLEPRKMISKIASVSFIFCLVEICSDAGTTQHQPHSVGHGVSPNVTQVQAVQQVSQMGIRGPPTIGSQLTTPATSLPIVSDTGTKSAKEKADPMCRMSQPKPTASKCRHRYYYFDQVSHLCKPTCSEEAPFAARSACDKICRSVFACFHRWADEEEDCELRHKLTVFSFNPRKRRCIKRRGCSYEGNNFPTLQECKLTCLAYRIAGIGVRPVLIHIVTEPPQPPPEQPHMETPPNTEPKRTVPEKHTTPVPLNTGVIHVLPPQDDRCSITISNMGKNACKIQKYYFDSHKRLCDPTCSSMAPFHSMLECVGTCRSVLVCLFTRLQNSCTGVRNITVYQYSPHRGRCFAGKSCDYKGNNFPTLEECRRTCGAFTGIEEPGEEDTTKVIPEISTKPTEEQAKKPERQQKSTSQPNQSPGVSQSGSQVALSPPSSQFGKVQQKTTAPTPMAPPKTKTAHTEYVKTTTHQDFRCFIFSPGSPQVYCEARRYYFDLRSRLCMPTCWKWAPFQSSSECTGLCRSVRACFLERKNASCKTRANITVFYYDFHSGQCIRGGGCAYTGNNFPTMEECRHTCISIAGLHKPTQVAIRTQAHATPPDKPNQEHSILYPPTGPVISPSLPQTAMQYSTSLQQANVTIPPRIQTDGVLQLTGQIASPGPEQAARQEFGSQNPVPVLPATEHGSKPHENQAVAGEIPPFVIEQHSNVFYAQSRPVITRHNGNEAFLETQMQQQIRHMSPLPLAVQQDTKQSLGVGRRNQYVSMPQQTTTVAFPYQYWIPPRDINNQFIPMYTGPMPFAYL